MTTAALSAAAAPPDERTYRRRIWAWTMYDWGNSAFATTVLAAVLPAYYSSVAGATLPSEATATAYWSVGLSISLLIGAVLSPILGTISDIRRNKKPLLSIFAGLGIVETGADYGAALTLVAGVFAGSAAWWLLLSGGVSLLRERLTPRRMRWVNRLSGTVLIAFGLAALTSGLV